jgi:hypothetical protein
MLSQIVNPSQRWRIAQGSVPDCPAGTIVTLATTGDRLEVSRPWFGVVAHVDLRSASIRASSDGRELTIGTASGEVVFQNEGPATPGMFVAATAATRPDAASYVGRVVQFGAINPNAEGWNLFVFLVLRRVNGWLIGLTQNGHPAGIAESNIAWANVLDAGPRHPSDRLVLSYVGPRTECSKSYESEAPTLAELGYQVSSQHFIQEPRNSAAVIIAILLGFLLAPLLVGIVILAWLIFTKPPGVLTVTLQRLPGSP